MNARARACCRRGARVRNTLLAVSLGAVLLFVLRLLKFHVFLLGSVDVRTASAIDKLLLGDDADARDGLTERLTIVLMTHAESGRHYSMPRVLTYYDSCNVVDKVVVIMNGMESTPSNFKGVSDKVEFAHFAHNSMNNRFMVHDRIDTNAVVVCDDDLILSCAVLRCNLQTWLLDPDRLVGNNIRRGNGFWYQGAGKEAAPRAALVIGRTMTMHKRYMREYETQYKDIQAWVDEPSFCEDLAMNAIVSAAHDRGPVFVDRQPGVRDRRSYPMEPLPETGGLSGRKKSWGSERNECLRWLNERFGGFAFATRAKVHSCAADGKNDDSELGRALHGFLRDGTIAPILGGLAGGD